MVAAPRPAADERIPVSTAETFDLLADTLDRRFAAGDRRTVLVMGAGFHHHLRAHLPNTASDPSGALWKLFTDWNGLLSRIAEDYEIPVLRHEDPAATWESLIIRISTQKRDAAARKSGRAERRARLRGRRPARAGCAAGRAAVRRDAAGGPGGQAGRRATATW
jgi:hypothetical protein